MRGFLIQCILYQANLPLRKMKSQRNRKDAGPLFDSFQDWKREIDVLKDGTIENFTKIKIIFDLEDDNFICVSEEFFNQLSQPPNQEDETTELGESIDNSVKIQDDHQQSEMIDSKNSEIHSKRVLSEAKEIKTAFDTNDKLLYDSYNKITDFSQNRKPNVKKSQSYFLQTKKNPPTVKIENQDGKSEKKQSKNLLYQVGNNVKILQIINQRPQLRKKHVWLPEQDEILHNFSIKLEPEREPLTNLMKYKGLDALKERFRFLRLYFNSSKESILIDIWKKILSYSY